MTDHSVRAPALSLGAAFDRWGEPVDVTAPSVPPGGSGFPVDGRGLGVVRAQVAEQDCLPALTRRAIAWPIDPLPITTVPSVIAVLPRW